MMGMMSSVEHIERYSLAFHNVINILETKICNGFCRNKCPIGICKNCPFIYNLAQIVTDYFDAKDSLDDIPEDTIIQKCVDDFCCFYNAERIVAES